MATTSISVIPDADDIRAVDNSVGLVRIDVGDLFLLFSVNGPHDGFAALDRLAEAVTEARTLLVSAATV